MQQHKRDYKRNYYLQEVNFASRPSAFTQKKKANERILPFVTTYLPGVNNLKQTLMEQWSLTQNQPLLKTIYLKPQIISYKRGKSLKDVCQNHTRSPCRPFTLSLIHI